jgi:hypothetical protein
MKFALVALLSSLLVSALEAQNHALAASRFVGEWVGLQTWAIDNPPPNIHQPQPVTVRIEVLDEKVVGVIMPFMGGEDGASFVDGRVVDGELHGRGLIGPPRLPNSAPPSPNTGWKESVSIEFSFVATGGSNDELIGTADVLMGEVPWMKYRYELKKKRSRY